MKLRIGQMVYVELIDHADGSNPIAFEAFGRIGRITRTAICLDSWRYPYSKNKYHKNKYDHNWTRWTILRSAIKRVTQLRPAED